MDYSNETLFYTMLLNSILKYHKEDKQIHFPGKPDYLVKLAWLEIEKYAKNGIKPAKEFHKKGFPNFRNFFKWAANDHHVWEILALIKQYGIVQAGKTVFKHAKAHKKV